MSLFVIFGLATICALVDAISEQNRLQQKANEEMDELIRNMKKRST